MYAIKTTNLTKYYGKARGIVEVNLEVPEGTIFGFIGPNGAGKSTTIRILLNFIYPTEGSAQIFGQNCVQDTKKIKQSIGYIPAEVSYYDDMRARDLFQYSAKFYNQDCTDRMNYLADRLDLDLNRKIDDMSYGNKKKVAVVQALLHAPKLLILDEPTGGLDPLIQNRFFELLKEENQNGTTVFFSSHVLSEVQKMCDKVAIIKEGRILKVENIEDLRQNKFRTIRVDFAKDEHSDLNLSGIIQKEIVNNSVKVLYSGEIKRLLYELSQLNVQNVTIEEPSLEEIFMHYYEKEGE